MSGGWEDLVNWSEQTGWARRGVLVFPRRSDDREEWEVYPHLAKWQNCAVWAVRVGLVEGLESVAPAVWARSVDHPEWGIQQFWEEEVEWEK